MIRIELFGLPSQCTVCICCWFYTMHKKVFDEIFLNILIAGFLGRSQGIFQEALQRHSRLDYLVPKSYLFHCAMSWFLTC